MTSLVLAPYPKSQLSILNNSPPIEQLNPLKQVQTEIAPTKRQKIIANRRRNFQMKKKTEVKLSRIVPNNISLSSAKITYLVSLVLLGRNAPLLMAMRS